MWLFYVQFACAAAILLVVLWYLYFFKCMWSVRFLPGPTPLPFIGCSYLFPNVKSLLSAFSQMQEKYGPICKMMVGFEPSLLIADYKMVEAVMRSKDLIEKSKSYRHFHNWLGTGLLTAGGDKWRSRRKLLTPTYHFTILESFLPVFDSVSTILVEELRLETKNDTVDIYPYITLCTLDIICETAMGTSVNALRNRYSEYVTAVKGMCNVIMEKTFSPMQHNQNTFQFTKNFVRERELLQILNNHTMDIIRRRRIETLETCNDHEMNRKIAFLDLLLQTKIDDISLSDEDLREEVATFMFEGHDTTASALSFALYEIANHPEVQRRIMVEQNDIFGSDRMRMADNVDLSAMKYLEVVIKETLRLYPSVPFYARETMDEINIGGIVVPKNFTLIIFALAIQRDATYYSEPHAFKPERFLQDNGNKFPYSFIPFSAGHRNCIGQKFAMLEMKATLSKVLRNYEVLACGHHVDLICETILKSANGICIRLRERF